ncbi:seminal plasma protein HSP-1 [Equus przewalskii]
MFSVPARQAAMAPRLGIFLIWAGACIFLQLDHVDGDLQTTGADHSATVNPDQQLIMTKHSATVTPENKCVFPFNYRGYRYYDCTRTDSFYRWCSLTGTYSGSWKYCAATDYAKCAFPFVYRGQTYDRCTTDGSLFRISWCSVTPNYDHHGAWKYC